ncbi:hypothetical protein GCM10008927_00770 [Amylibacter ulvae]|uniref:Uncharacterized protein n=1 Tax=Paramylibacter ulvae TaxID=1651968 RepID=A0ABQ3CTR5_9RHOB|nr:MULTISPECIES: hypothetical protein [Amylibacter]GHA40462.1 hypothetical protein GCM10008927_00770 [Amylibacter ulvae]
MTQDNKILHTIRRMSFIALIATVIGVGVFGPVIAESFADYLIQQ